MDFYVETYEFGICVHGLQTGRRISDLIGPRLKDLDLDLHLKTRTRTWTYYTGGLELGIKFKDLDLKTRT